MAVRQPVLLFLLLSMIACNAFPSTAVLAASGQLIRDESDTCCASNRNVAGPAWNTEFNPGGYGYDTDIIWQAEPSNGNNFYNAFWYPYFSQAENACYYPHIPNTGHAVGLVEFDHYATPPSGTTYLESGAQITEALHYNSWPPFFEDTFWNYDQGRYDYIQFTDWGSSGQQFAADAMSFHWNDVPSTC